MPEPNPVDPPASLDPEPTGHPDSRLKDGAVVLGVLLSLILGSLLFYLVGSITSAWAEQHDLDPPEAVASMTPLSGHNLYMNNCASCHGARGQGTPRMGSPLVGSGFVQQADDAAMLQFLKRGRSPGDPNSVMKGFMPPRGGNPNLTDPQLNAIISHLREINTVGTGRR